MKEQECTDFISRIPTTFDETVAMDGKVGEYAVIARRKADTWYVGAMSNWDARELTLDFSFLPKGNYEVEYLRIVSMPIAKQPTIKKKLLKLIPGIKSKFNFQPEEDGLQF